MDNAILLIAAVAVVGGVGVIIFALLRMRGGTDAGALEGRMAELAKAQSEIAGRFSQAIEAQSAATAELQKAVNERLDALVQRSATT